MPIPRNASTDREEAGEVEIARVFIESATGDVTAVYAQPHEGRVRYRVVDEYSGGTFKSANATVGTAAGAMISSTQQQKSGRPAADGAGRGKEGEAVPSGVGGGQETSQRVPSSRND